MKLFYHFWCLEINYFVALNKPFFNLPNWDLIPLLLTQSMTGFTYLVTSVARIMHYIYKKVQISMRLREGRENTDPVPPCGKQINFIMTHNHQVPASIAIYWPSTIKYQPASFYNSSSRTVDLSLFTTHLMSTYSILGLAFGSFHMNIMKRTNKIQRTTFHARSLLLVPNIRNIPD